MAKTKTLDDLFYDTLRDIYYAEKQILKALPKMAKGAQSSDLAAAFEKHRAETEGQIDRLEQVFELIGKAARGKKCDAIEGILAEGEEILDEFADSPALDAGLILHERQSRAGSSRLRHGDAVGHQERGGRVARRACALA